LVIDSEKEKDIWVIMILQKLKHCHK